MKHSFIQSHIDFSTLPSITKQNPFQCFIEKITTKKITQNSKQPHTHKITVYGKDASGILSHVVATISLQGIEIINANAQQTTFDGTNMFYNTFVVNSSNAYTDTWKKQLQKTILNQGHLIHNKKKDEAHLYITERIANTYTKENTRCGHAPIIDIKISPVIHKTLKNALQIHVEGQDQHSILYMLSLAFEKQNLIVHSFSVKTYNSHIKDIFLASPLDSKPINITALHIKLMLTTQFAHYVRLSPNPLAAMLRFQQLIKNTTITDHNNPTNMLLQNESITQLFAQLLGSSDFLWEDFIRINSEESIKILARLPTHDSTNLEKNTIDIRPSEYEKYCKKMLAQCTSIQEKILFLNKFKDLQSYYIDVNVLLHHKKKFDKLSERLSALARVFIRQITLIAEQELKTQYGHPRSVAGLKAQWVLFGLGKFGGSALGYASDIEIMLIYDNAGHSDGKNSINNREYFSKMMQKIKQYTYAKKDGIFCIDTRLRPYGVNGPLAVRLDNFINYYSLSGDSHSVERLSLCRMRPVAGNPKLAERILTIHENILYNDNSINWSDVFALRKKQLHSKVKPGTYNAKFSAGALVDVEYTVQLLQIKHGAQYTQLRQPSVRNSIMCLQEVGEISEEETYILTDAYAFFRNLINALRMRRGNALDLTLPPKDTWELEHLARRMDYKSQDISSSRQLLLDFNSHCAQVYKFVQTHLKDVHNNSSLSEENGLNPASIVLSDNPNEDFLALQIFKDKKNALASIMMCTQRNSKNKNKGPLLKTFSRILLLAWPFLERSGNADRMLRDFARTVEQILKKNSGTVLEFYNSFLIQPAKLDLLLEVFSSSRYLSEIIIQNPQFIDKICDTQSIQKQKTYKQYLQELCDLIKDYNPSSQDKNIQNHILGVIREYKKIETLRIITRDICISAPFENIVQEISALASAILYMSLIAALNDYNKLQTYNINDCTKLMEKIPMAILAFGKFGANELNYSSDLDLLCVCSENKNFTEQEITKIFQQSLQYVGKYTEYGKPYRVDLRLRPYGNASPISQKTSYLYKYYLEEAKLWELQAATKLGTITGNHILAQSCIKNIHEAIKTRLNTYKTKTICGEIHALRCISVKNHTKNINPHFEVKNSWGGIRDIEFAVQTLQLIHVQQLNTHNSSDLIFKANTLDTIEALKNAKIISNEVQKKLCESYIFLRKIEHFLQVYEDQQLHVIPKNNHDFISHLTWLMIEERDEDSFLKQLQSIKQYTHTFYTNILVKPY